MRMETWPQSVGLTSESASHLHNIKMKERLDLYTNRIEYYIDRSTEFGINKLLYSQSQPN
jgi:hypothetical protein